MNDEKPSVLLTGVTGFIGGRLLYALDQEGFRVRSLVRSKTKIKINGMLNNVMEVVTGDLLDSASLPPAMEGIETAYYLVHSMGGRNERQARNFAESDNAAARNFLSAAEAAGVNRIIYLGGLGESEEGLSKHLASRREVGDILKSGSIDVTVLQAAVIIGAGGASFEMIRHLVERLPVIMCPKEINTRCQPIAVANVIEYLVGCLKEPATRDRTLDIGGPEVLTYRNLIEIYAEVRRLKRTIIRTLGLSPDLYGKFIEMISPVPAGLVSLLLAGMKNEVVCHDDVIRELIPVKLLTMNEAICEALVDEDKGPGRLPSQQACFLE